MEERPLKMGDAAHVSPDSPAHAAVQRIADNGMADGAQMDTNLVRPPGVDGDVSQRHRRSDRLGAYDPRHRFPAASGAGRHPLAIDGIASNRRVDPAPRVDDAPHERDVLFFDLAVAELPRQLLVRGVVFRDDHQP